MVRPSGYPKRSLLLVTVLLGLAMALGAVASNGPPTVSTNQSDYSPGSTAQITGSGFHASETVTLQVMHADGSEGGEGHEPWTVTTDGDGNFTSTWFVDPDDSLGSTFLLTADCAHGLHAQTTFTDSIGVDFRQGANNETNGAVQGLGNTHWINSIIQSSNSLFFEGMLVPQRTVLYGLPGKLVNGQPDPTQHTLNFTHEWSKGGIHAYDWLDSYSNATLNLGGNTAVVNKAEIDAFTGSNVTYLINVRGPEIGTGGQLSAQDVINAIRPDVNGNFIDVVVPDDPYISKDGSTQARINAYEALWGNRTIRIYSDQPISTAQLTLQHSVGNGGDTGDSNVNYVLNWTTASASTQAVVEMAGHLSVSVGQSDLTPGGWGAGLGSSQISGGPYHFNLGQADNTSLGSQDNQIKGADIRCIPPVCSITPPTGPVCPGTTSGFNGPAGPGLTYLWSITGNGTIQGSTTSQTVSVLAGSTCNGSYTLTLAVGNGCATTTCSQTVQVVDTTAPVIICPAGGTVQCEADVPGPGTATATDNCGTPTISVVTGPLVGGACGGTVTRTYTATDACGNSASCTQVFTVNDTTDPVFTSCPAGGTVQCEADVPGPGTATATDNCGTPTITSVLGALVGGPCGGTKTRTYTATDACGNTATCTQVFTVDDTTAPVLEGCPTDSPTVQCLADVPPPANVTATDNCGGSVPVDFTETQSKPDSNCGNIITRTWKATDSCGNEASCSQTITVDDTTAPSITCPEAVTVQCKVDVPPPDPDSVQASDNCGGEVSVTWEGDSSDGKTCPETITRTYKATDDCDNTATCTQIITVDDTTPPELECPPEILDPGDALPPAATTPEELAEQGGSVSDNCGPVTLTSADVDDGAPCPAEYHTVTRTYTATDACGNVSTCTQTIRVKNSCGSGVIRGLKFYDATPDGARDPVTEPGLNGWKFRLFQVVDGVEVLISEQFTDTVEGVDGVVEFTNLLDGTYILRECDPVETTWLNTTPKQCTVIVLNGVAEPLMCFFGNVCLGAGGGHTLGFWSNKNGQAILKANDPGWRALLNACNLVNGNGTPYKVPAPPVNFNTAYASFRTWLLNGTAVNMSYMLSVQLAAMKLNIAAGFVNPDQYVFCGPGLGFSQIGQVTIDANAFLANYPLTLAGNPNRALGEAIKNCLDSANNNLNFVQPQPCPYTFPPD